jgi:hypothetical protein
MERNTPAAYKDDTRALRGVPKVPVMLPGCETT